MARTGLEKAEVRVARDRLIAQSVYPSVDAVRIALGNTGSKSTIHKYLKELEHEGADTTAGPALSDTLQTLVQQLAQQLRKEAAQDIAEAERALAERAQAQAAQVSVLQARLDSSQEQVRELQTRLAHTEAQLTQQQDALRAAQAALAANREAASQRALETAQLQGNLAAAERALYVEQQQVRRLEIRVDEMRGYEGQCMALSAQLEERNEWLAKFEAQLAQRQRDSDEARAGQLAAERELARLQGGRA